MSGLILVYSSIKDWLGRMAESFIAWDIFQADTEWMHNHLTSGTHYTLNLSSHEALKWLRFNKIPSLAFHTSASGSRSKFPVSWSYLPAVKTPGKWALRKIMQSNNWPLPAWQTVDIILWIGRIFPSCWIILLAVVLGPPSVSRRHPRASVWLPSFDLCWNMGHMLQGWFLPGCLWNSTGKKSVVGQTCLRE